MKLVHQKFSMAYLKKIMENNVISLHTGDLVEKCHTLQTGGFVCMYVCMYLFASIKNLQVIIIHVKIDTIKFDINFEAKRVIGKHP